MSGSGNALSSGDDCEGGLSALPDYILDYILNFLEDARDIARAQAACPELRKAGRNVLSLRITCLDLYHERARNDDAYEGKSFHSNVISHEVSRLSASGSTKSFHSNVISHEVSGPSASGSTKSFHEVSGPSTSGSTKSFHEVSGPSTSGSTKSFHEVSGPSTSGSTKSFHEVSGPSTSGSSSKSLRNFIGFKDLVVGILKSKHLIVQLRIEVEPKLQSKSVTEGERRRTDFWLTDHYFVAKWLPDLGRTLQHLCIIDYGQQAIMRRSKIVKLLSENCKLLKTLDLRNLFIDTSDMEVMLSMVSLTLRCVKVVAQTLQHLNENMPNLQTLALLGVFGADGGNLQFEDLKVLCLGLSTLAKDIEMRCPKLEKLQLKMQCPQSLIITAQNLKCVAFNLDVIEPSKVVLNSMVGLEELLYGATSFETLSSLVDMNVRNLKKLFLDIPCMALAEDGSFLGVLKDASLQIPSFNKLSKCKNLEVLNVGPGLWYSMESQVEKLLSVERWPSMQTLVVHMIPHDMEAAIVVLRTLLRVSVTRLDVYIHRSSPISEELMSSRIAESVRNCDQTVYFEIHPWQKSLNFSCFSF